MDPKKSFRNSFHKSPKRWVNIVNSIYFQIILNTGTAKHLVNRYNPKQNPYQSPSSFPFSLSLLTAPLSFLVGLTLNQASRPLFPWWWRWHSISCLESGPGSNCISFSHKCISCVRVGTAWLLGNLSGVCQPAWTCLEATPVHACC